MTLSSRDIEKVKNKPFKEPWWLKVLGRLFSLIISLPWIRNKLADSAGALSGRIFRLQHKGDFEKAAKVAIYAMDKYRHHKDKWAPGMEHHQWWQFVQYASESASRTSNQNLKNKIIYEANRGVEPFKGYNVAYSFLEICKWEYASERLEHAIKAAKIASNADPTWAKPDYILGRIGLLTGEISAEEHLSEAIRKDQRILFQISNDDLCKSYPHIIAKLKKEYSVGNNEN